MTDTKQTEALRLATCLQDHVVTYPQLSEDEPGGYCGEVDRVMDEAADELRRLHAENTTLQQGYDAARLEIEALRMRTQADSQPALPKITAEDRSFLHYNPNTDDIVKWVQHYASAAITADRAMRAQAAPAAVTSPLTKLQRKAIAICFTSDKVSVSEVQRKLSISYADAQTLCQSIVDLGLTDELELAPSLKRGAPATHPAPVAQGDVEDAARYRWLRRGQHWSVIDGIGDTLRSGELDAAIDAARKQGATMTEPTYAELRKLAEECGIGWAAGLGGMDDFLRAFSSAVLAKWGTPPEELIDAIEQLMGWQVKNVDRWHNRAYDYAHHVLAKFKAAHGIKGGQHGDAE